MLPVAVDAMGGDHAPDVIVAGARRAADELGVPVILVGRPDAFDPLGLDVLPASEVIEMGDDAASAVRAKKDASLNVAARAVKDGVASAMVSAGNTGATMGSALLRMGRIKGVNRPAIATPLPRPGVPGSTVLLDAGANAECQADWLVQFAQMGSVLAAERYGIAEPRVGLLSIGEEDTKGTTLVKETHALLRSAPSRKVVVRMARAAGEISAAPRPCTARATISCSSFWARPPASDAIAKSTMPDMNIRRRPSRSASRPPSSRKPPKNRV